MATLTTNVASWNTAGTAVNLARITDGHTERDDWFRVHPKEADGQHITFSFQNSYTEGSFVFYNRDTADGNRIQGSTITIFNNDVLQETITITETGEVFTKMFPTTTQFDKVVLTFDGDSQNFRQIEILGVLP